MQIKFSTILFFTLFFFIILFKFNKTENIEICCENTKTIFHNKNEIHFQYMVNHNNYIDFFDCENNLVYKLKIKDQKNKIKII